MSDDPTRMRTPNEPDLPGGARAANAGQPSDQPAPPAPGQPRPPHPEPKATTDGSAPNANPPGTAAAVGVPSAPVAAGSPGQPAPPPPGEPTAADPLANLVAQEREMDAAALAQVDPWGRGAYFDPDVEQHPVVRELRTHFPETILDVVRFRDETTIHIRREDLRDICAYLRDHPQIGLNFLTDVTAVDMLRLRDRPRFDVVVMLYSLRNRVRVRLKAGCDDGEPVPSLLPLWNGADWLEREAYDMFGIVFEGHPNLRRILLADDWEEGHPLRKDYPLRGWREFPVYNEERRVARSRTRWSGRGV